MHRITSILKGRKEKNSQEKREQDSLFLSLSIDSGPRELGQTRLNTGCSGRSLRSRTCVSPFLRALSPAPLLPNPLIDRAPPILRGRDPRASFPHLHRRLNRNVSSHLFQSRDIYTYIHINNISVKETNSTSSSLLPRSHLKGPPLNRSDPWNYLYSFFFFSFLISTLKTDRYRHASGGRPNDATRHDTARHEAIRHTHVRAHRGGILGHADRGVPDGVVSYVALCVVRDETHLGVNLPRL